MSVSMEPKRFIVNGIVCNCGECKHYDKPYPNSYCSGCVEFNTILTELNLTLRMKGISFGEFCHRLGINI